METKAPSLSADCPILLERLMETRLILQASSGAGKTTALKRLIEQIFGQVQVIVIDPEGEFGTLREKLDFLIFAPHGGDAAAHPKTAGVLAHRLLSTGYSAVLDIYDLKPHERIEFVRRFLESMVNAPRDILRDVVIVLDEAHIFAPEGGKCESAQAVIDVATRGRKRGQCLVVATQRLAMLDKNVTAQMQNKLIGQNSADNDIKRAAMEIGKSVRDTFAALQPLNPGEFLAFGPALSRDVRQIKIGPLITSHAKSGKRGIQVPPPPTDKARKALAKDFQDIPQEAEREAKTLEDLQGEVRSLRASLAAAEKRAAAGGASAEEVNRRISAAREAGHADALNLYNVEYAAMIAEVETAREILEGGLLALPVRRKIPKFDPKDPKWETIVVKESPAKGKIAPAPVVVALGATWNTPAAAPRRDADGQAPTIPQQRILDALAKLEALDARCDKITVAAFAGASPRSSSYTNNLGALRTLGLINYPAPGYVVLTDAGRDAANKPASMPTLEQVHGAWFAILTNPQASILRSLIEAYPAAVPKEDLAGMVGASATSSSFTNNLGALRSLGAIEYPSKGFAKASSIVFPGRAK